MKFKPIDKMLEQVEIQKDISDAAYFNALMYTGRMLLKVTVAALVAAVDEGRDRHRYRLKYRLVRADSYGTWCEVLDEILTGVTAHNLCEGITRNDGEIYQLTKRTAANEWQHQCVTLLLNCLKLVNEADLGSRNRKIQSKEWFSRFARLRNRTQGHGASMSGQLSQMCPHLHESIKLFVDNYCLFQRPWAYIAPTLKGKYHVVRWTEEADSLRRLATSKGKKLNLPEGVYIHYVYSSVLRWVGF